MSLFALHIGVEQGHIALAATPEHIVLSAELNGSVYRVLYLQHSACGCGEIWVGGGSVHIASVTKYVRSAPKQLDAAFLLLLLCVGDNCLEVAFVLLDAAAFFDEVNVVEAVVFDSKLLHQFETRIHLVLCSVEGGFAFLPRHYPGASAELVATFGAERMPPRQRELEPILHLASANHSFRLVVMESHRVL